MNNTIKALGLTAALAAASTGAANAQCPEGTVPTHGTAVFQDRNEVINTNFLQYDKQTGTLTNIAQLPGEAIPQNNNYAVDFCFDGMDEIIMETTKNKGYGTVTEYNVARKENTPSGLLMTATQDKSAADYSYGTYQDSFENLEAALAEVTPVMNSILPVATGENFARLNNGEIVMYKQGPHKMTLPHYITSASVNGTALAIDESGQITLPTNQIESYLSLNEGAYIAPVNNTTKVQMYASAPSECTVGETYKINATWNNIPNSNNITSMTYGAVNKTCQLGTNTHKVTGELYGNWGNEVTMLAEVNDSVTVAGKPDCPGGYCGDF